jgi:hypothetical protein
MILQETQFQQLCYPGVHEGFTLKKNVCFPLKMTAFSVSCNLIFKVTRYKRCIFPELLA